MIIGKTISADGGDRRVPIRHTQIVDQSSKKLMINYLNEAVYQKCRNSEWVGINDLFPNIPNDLTTTPLNILIDICREKFKDSPKSLNINLSKYLGMLLREAVYYSDIKYLERMVGSVRKYKLVIKV